MSRGGWGRCGGEAPLPLSRSPKPGSGVGAGVLGQLGCLTAVSDPLTVGGTPSGELLFWVPGLGIKGAASCPFLCAGPPAPRAAFDRGGGERRSGPGPKRRRACLTPWTASRGPAGGSPKGPFCATGTSACCTLGVVFGNRSAAGRAEIWRSGFAAGVPRPVGGGLYAQNSVVFLRPGVFVVFIE